MTPSSPLLPVEDLEYGLARTDPAVWDALRKQNLFLTGGTGFFGHWLLGSLLFANDQLNLQVRVTVLTRNPDAFRAKSPGIGQHPAVTLHQGDVRSFDFPPGAFGYVLHAATDASEAINRADPMTMLDTIAQGTRRVLEFSKQAQTRRFLYASSGAVYGRQPPEISHIAEDYMGAPDPTAPFSAYGGGKRYAENLTCLFARSYGFEAVLARCWALLGAYLPLDAHYAAGNFIGDVLRGGSIQISGDGTPMRSYLYGSDLAIWLWTLLVQGQSCRAYNVGSDDAISIADLAGRIAGLVSPAARVQVAKEARTDALPERYVPSVARAKTELGLVRGVELDEALRRTFQWNAKLKS